MKHDEKTTRSMALLFLEEVRARALVYSERLDPEEERRYESDPVLRALDAVVSAANGPLYQAKAGVKLPGAHLLEKEFQS